MESSKVQVAGIITKDAHAIFSGGESGTGFNEFLKQNMVPAIDGIDTRSLVEKIRESGAIVIGQAAEFDYSGSQTCPPV